MNTALVLLQLVWETDFPGSADLPYSCFSSLTWMGIGMGWGEVVCKRDLDLVSRKQWLQNKQSKVIVGNFFQEFGIGTAFAISFTTVVIPRAYKLDPQTQSTC